MVDDPVLHECSQAVTVGLVGGSKIVKLRLEYEQAVAQFPPLPLHLPELLHDIVCGEGGVWAEEGDGDSQHLTTPLYIILNMHEMHVVNNMLQF